jgi:hypothetical protein
MNQEGDLPSPAAYKPQCQHSSGNWLAYQTSLTEVRVVEFNSNCTLRSSFTIDVGP